MICFSAQSWLLILSSFQVYIITCMCIFRNKRYPILSYRPIIKEYLSIMPKKRSFNTKIEI